MNDALRFLIDIFVAASAKVFCGILFIRMKAYRWNQERLRRKYKIAGGTPIRGYDGQSLREPGSNGCYAYTSGSTKNPKKIPYDRKRLLLTRLVFMDTFWRYLAEAPLKNRSIFIFSSMRRDGSLTSLLLQEPGPPPYLFGLQAPHLVQNCRAVRTASRGYGETAVRLWILAVSNPSLIYATNPSTIAAFLHDIHENWDKSRRLAMESGALRKIQKRIAVRGAGDRLRKIAASPRPLPISEMFPALGAFACWDGGYVSPFIEQIRRYLPESRYAHLPMYSMSTETIETIGVTNLGRPAFLPLAPGVLYEFIEEGGPDFPSNILLPSQLQPGTRYSMIVSDSYGLRRYQTEDVFECCGFVNGIPDLRFAQRRNLSYSFTGEKLTADQLNLAYRHVESCFPQLRRHGFLTCFPSKPPAEATPRYRLIYVRSTEDAEPGPELASLVEEKLSEFNLEFRSKIAGRRLGRMEMQIVSLNDFIKRVSGPESQFKFLPLYTKLWETQATTAMSGS